MQKLLKSRASLVSWDVEGEGQKGWLEFDGRLAHATSYRDFQLENSNDPVKSSEKIFHASTSATVSHPRSDCRRENVARISAGDSTKPAERRSSLNASGTESNKAERRAASEKCEGPARESKEIWSKHRTCTRDECRLGNICTVLEQNERIIRMLETLIDRSDGCENIDTLYSRPEGFPLQTLQEFNAFEENPYQTNELKKYLTFVGGRTLREALYHFQKETMSDNLVMHFTWWGLTEGTRGFYATRLAKVFFDVVNRLECTKPKDRSHFQSELSEVFRSVKQRVANRRYKLQSQHRQGFMRTLRKGADNVYQSTNQASPV